MNRLAVLLATSGGAGYVPVAPGTAGSAVGVLLFLAMADWSPTGLVLVIVVLTIAGTWASGVAERHFGRSDPGEVVVDEVVGQLLTLVGTGVGAGGAVLGFVIFRALDTLKPWPVNRAEALPGGIGIMADDVLAGLLGNLVLRGLLLLSWPA